MTVLSVGGTGSFVTKIAVSNKLALLSPVLSFPCRLPNCALLLCMSSLLFAYARVKSLILFSVPFIGYSSLLLQGSN